MKKDARKEAGDVSEALALAHLQAQGLRLVLRNYRCRGGEIDLVMMDRQTLVLVEVRFRSHASFGGAAASVDAGKQKRLMLAARHLLMKHAELAHYRARFDVLALTPQTGGGSQVEWLRDAFRMN